MILLWFCRCAEVRRWFGLVVAVVLLWGVLPVLSIHAETTVVPLAAVRPRYDSNVFRRPKDLLEPGTQIDDFVTTVIGGLDLLHKTRDVDVDARVLGTFNAFLENTDRNYIGMLVRGDVGLDQWADRYVRGARLRIRENLRYTPEQPSFLAGARDPIQDESLNSGVQGFRANTLVNTTDIKGVYPVSRDLSVEGGYLFGLRRMGQIQGGDVPGVTYFNTMAHTWFGGPRYRLTRNDSIAALYRQTFIAQSQSDGGRIFNTNLITFEGAYDKGFQEWGLILRGGVTLAEPYGRTFASGSLEVTSKPERDTVVRLAVLREARPSFFIQGGAIISNAGRLGISHRIYERLTLDATAAFAYNQYLPDTEQTLQNFTATSKLAYKLTRNITGELFYLYQYIISESSSVDFQYPRNEVGFMLSLEWK